MKSSQSLKIVFLLGLAGVVVWGLVSTGANLSKRALGSFNVESSREYQEGELVSEQEFLALLPNNSGPITAYDLQLFSASLEKIKANWDVSYVPMILEASSFLRTQERQQLMSLVELKTGQQFGRDRNRWFQWIWAQEFEAHPNYASFKSKLYSRVDLRFAEYFVETDDATIELDEIRWGGVRRDGIPPLKNPEMLTADTANYLADSDVVFGIELNGDARAYPKRILAWHEMFKDTLGGESICGVY